MTREAVFFSREIKEALDAQGWARCTGCFELKEKTEFSPDIPRWNHIKPRCRECHNAYTNAVNRLRAGWTEKEYNQALIYQDGKCAICGDSALKTLHADHDHKTMKKRKLLCLLCNQGLGRFKDNADILRAAAVYLEENS